VCAAARWTRKLWSLEVLPEIEAATILELETVDEIEAEGRCGTLPTRVSPREQGGDR
jgi:hypothetical protein